MAIMEVGGWATRCSECHQKAEWDMEGHLRVPDLDGIGCGAKWTGITFTAGIFDLGIFEDPRIDNDYYPDWMKELPIV